MSGTSLKDHRIVIFGAGNAGVGVADQIYNAMRRTGINDQEARSTIWLIDKFGLLTEASPNLASFQKPYARSIKDIATWHTKNPSLLEVVKELHPTILIGCSACKDAFTEEVIKTIAEHTTRPIILPLSNPNELAEATPAALIDWTRGQAIIATGSPFADVFYANKRYSIAQSNNALAFPGIGLGAISVKAKYLSDDMLWAATLALQNCSSMNPNAPILPKLSETTEISRQVAIAVATQARKEGLASVPDSTNLTQLINKTRWEAKYYPYKKR